MSNKKQVILTEVGNFGNLNIDDPTMTEVKKIKQQEQEDIDTLIKESIKENANISL